MKHLTFKGLASVNRIRGKEWMGRHGGPEDALFRAVELGGETGEVLNDVKKLARHQANVRGGVDLGESMVNIADELADVIICADRLAECLNIDLAQAVVDKFNQTSRKQGLQTYLEIDD